MKPQYKIHDYGMWHLTRVLVYNWKGINEVGLCRTDERNFSGFEENLVAIFKIKFKTI